MSNTKEIILKDGMEVMCPLDYKTTCFSYVTPGKKYRVFGVSGVKDVEHGAFFSIKNDDERQSKCTLKNCAHLDDLNWIIVEPETPQP